MNGRLLKIMITDENLYENLSQLPKQVKGKIVSRALIAYFESQEGQGVVNVLSIKNNYKSTDFLNSEDKIARPIARPAEKKVNEKAPLKSFAKKEEKSLHFKEESDIISSVENKEIDSSELNNASSRISDVDEEIESVVESDEEIESVVVHVADIKPVVIEDTHHKAKSDSIKKKIMGEW